MHILITTAQTAAKSRRAVRNQLQLNSFMD